MSIAGGVEKAPGRASSAGCTALQIFVKNNNRWQGPPLKDGQPEKFASSLEEANLPVANVFAHTAYLINLASPKKDVIEKSVDALVDELERCQALKLPGLVMHPGSHLKAGRDQGIAQIIELTLKVFEKTPEVKTRLLFETTAGTGSNLGGPFEDIQEILDGIGQPLRAGCCLDTCHIFAAGYDIRDSDTYENTMAEFDRTIGFSNLHAVHLNDSQHDLDSHKDRHEHIGQGKIGKEAFRLLMRDSRFQHIPMSLETDKGDDLAEDRMNLELLRELAETESPV